MKSQAKTTILSYKEVLDIIKNKNNHLLIGNGFNYGLGINTGYKAIFEKMAENNKGIYQDALKIVEDCNFDLEYFISKLEEDINPNNIFLKKYVRNKIKLDFMQATQEIVKSEIKNIYAEKNEGVFLLLKEFTNYFTLNYDSFLYLLLLKYKPIENHKKNTIILQPKLKFIEDDLNERQNNIYKEIKNARENAKLKLDFNNIDNIIEKDLKKLTKVFFTQVIREYSKVNKKGWRTKDIDRVIKFILEEEKKNEVLNRIDDGSRELTLFDKSEFVYDIPNDTQNLFFLHGSFHIYKEGKEIKKITQQQDKALYEKLEEVLNTDGQDIVCVFQNENKINAINNNKYLKYCYEKLKQLSGNMVIIGCSLSDNDDHIFAQISNSNIDNIYISAFKDKEVFAQKAKEKFPQKNVYLFDADTISYEFPKNLDGQNEY